MSDWERAANRGELNLAIYTARGATEAGIPILPSAEFLGVLFTDFETIIPVNFLNARAILDFIENMAPRTIDVHTAAGESVEDLAAQMQNIIDEQKARAAEFTEATLARIAAR